MNKNAIQRFAIWARKELIAQVSQRAYQYDITADGYGDYDTVAVGGRLLSEEERKQRKDLIHQIQGKGYAQVMEEVAYTWFNRFIALRFMEVNNYLPTHIRIFSDASGAFKPEILTSALHLDLPGLDMGKVSSLIEKNQTEDLYRYLLLTECNSLSSALPRMFEKMGSYTELLLPNNILRQEGVLGRMVADIPEEDWTDQVQIIGWLYQYYNTELKDDTFALLKKNVKITKERIPSATQLFTPDWIVRYMVENSLGRLWIEGHPDDELKAGWKYYLDEAEQEADVQAQLEEIRAEYRHLRPQDIKVIDPCMGSGHILVYAFDVLVQIYKRAGFSERDATQSILENNLYGLDIDDRAAQLAYFAVMMKARQYDRRIFTRNIQPHVYAIVESNGVHISAMWRLGAEQGIAERLLEELKDAKEYGSILNLSLTMEELTALRRRLMEIDEMSTEGDLMDRMESLEIRDNLMLLVEVAEVFAQKYDIVVTNPPYRALSDCSTLLINFTKKEYPDSKNDLSTVFMEKTMAFCNNHGYMSMINIPVWMSKSSFTELRYSFLVKYTFINMLHCGRGIFGSDFGTTTFVVGRRHIPSYCATFHQLFDEMGAVDSIEQKEAWFFERKGRFTAQQRKFLNISSYPIAYSTSPRLLEILDKEMPLSECAYPRKGLTTGDNDTFIRLWFEVEWDKFSFGANGAKWFPMTKGGDFRRWYGNNDYVVNWENDGFEIKNFKDGNGKLRSVPRNTQFYFRESISWNDTTATGKIAFRYQPEGYISNASGPCVFADKNLIYLFGLLNSVVSQKLLEILAPNMKFEVGQMALVPIIFSDKQEIVEKVKETVQIVKQDWDSFETSWDFKQHPLVCSVFSVEDAFAIWQQKCEARFNALKSNEEELNRIFIDIYGLQGELPPEVEDRDVTVRRADLGRDIRSLISYAVGCMFGRYSLDEKGLILAGQPFSDKFAYATVPVTGAKFAGADALYTVRSDCYLETADGGIKRCTYAPDPDNIIPICDDDYFDDDITGRFVKWVEAVFGKETLEENLKFIADALGGKGSSREIIRNYFLNDFYADHLKTYQKRPIYWLFDSGKKNGFKALIYMHRYQSDLLARLRTDYVHEQQERYRTQLKHIGEVMDSVSASERVKLAKQQKKLQEQALELQKYEEKIHHLADQNIEIDLDDGVKHNYALFEDVLARIK